MASCSVVIATKGRPERLRRSVGWCLQAVRAGTEVIVVDGDPQRSGERVVNELRARAHDHALRYIASTPGTCLQRNVGMDEASGEIVVFLDDDCVFDARLFTELLGAYSDETIVGATGLVVEPSHQRVGSKEHSRLRWIFLGGGRQGSMSSVGFRRPIYDVHTARDVEYMPGPLMSARRELAIKVRFDENLGTYGLGEDDDFSYRLSRLGRIRFQPRAIVYHAEAGFAQQDRRALDRVRVANRAYLFRKNFPQTARTKAAFATLLLMLCGHRALNGEWAGLLGLAEGIRQEYLPPRRNAPAA